MFTFEDIPSGIVQVTERYAIDAPAGRYIEITVRANLVVFGSQMENDGPIHLTILDWEQQINRRIDTTILMVCTPSTGVH